jgi:hypothetical protein
MSKGKRASVRTSPSWALLGVLSGALGLLRGETEP